MILVRTACLFLASAALLSSAVVRAEDAPALTFDALGKVVCKDGKPPVFPKTLAALDGKKVRVTGYISPFDQHTLRLKKFILTPEENPGCYQCNPPDANAVVFVRLPASATPMAWKSATVTIEGSLHLNGVHKEADKESESFLATVDDAVVVAKK